MSALARVYSGTHQRRVLGEDGTSKMVELNKTVFDEQTQTNITLNDLTIGEYDVVCEMGPAFNSAQKESARAFETLAAIDPSIAQRGMDIWLKNKKEPGMGELRERVREDMFKAGQIPESQMTDDEKQKMAEAQAQAAQQPPQPDPLMLAAQAEELKGQADMINAQTDQQVAQGEQQLKVADLQLRQQEQQLSVDKFLREKDDKFNVDAAKIDQGQQALDQKAQKDAIAAQQKQQQLDMQEQKQQLEEFAQMLAAQQQQINEAETRSKIDNTDADTLNKRLEAAEKTGDLSGITNDELMRIATGA